MRANFTARQSVGIALRFFLVVQLFSIHSSWSDESFESDRGYRQPAVVGPAIFEDEAQSNIAGRTEAENAELNNASDGPDFMSASTESLPVKETPREAN